VNEHTAFLDAVSVGSETQRLVTELLLVWFCWEKLL